MRRTRSLFDAVKLETVLERRLVRGRTPMSLYVLWRVKFKRVITAFIPWYQIGLKDFDVEMSKCTLLSGRLTLNRCCIYVFGLCS